VLRHTCITKLVRGGNDVVLVAEIAGTADWRPRAATACRRRPTVNSSGMSGLAFSVAGGWRPVAGITPPPEYESEEVPIAGRLKSSPTLGGPSEAKPRSGAL